MKAIIYTKYGSPDVLQLKEVEKPTPKEKQVLVKVIAASANPLDWHRMRGAPFLARLDGGLLKPNNTALGADLAGRVEAVGSAVTQFRPGDEVYGATVGSFAEYACVGESKLALKPTKLSFEAAAAVPVAAFTALQGLRDKGQLQAGQKVLINGAAGGVGIFAMQIAKALGAEVTAVCSTRNLDMVRSIGADSVIDYTKEDFTKSGQRYDLILDAIANHSISEYRRTLTPTGACVIVGFSDLWHLFVVMALGSRPSGSGSQKISMMLANTTQKDLLWMNDLFEAGKVVPVIDRCYPLNEVPEAIRYLETKHARGKVVITIGNGS
jgi:NADPH:quinone reductase-like Zn-dependent oxidoreductase